MIKELRRHWYRISAGTLYPLLHGLEKRGLLTVTDERNGSSTRRVYRATRTGRAALKAGRAKVRELFGELFESEGGTYSGKPLRVPERPAAVRRRGPLPTQARKQNGSAAMETGPIETGHGVRRTGTPSHRRRRSLVAGRKLVAASRNSLAHSVILISLRGVAYVS